MISFRQAKKHCTKFSIKNFFSKSDQIRRKLEICMIFVKWWNKNICDNTMMLT